jgi:diguanylate cyclase (GGDEF)-like protein/PAS domain S-box-containing protein
VPRSLGKPDAGARTLPEQLSHSKLASLLGNLPGMAFRYGTDRDWTMDLVSSGALELTGYPAAHFQQQPRARFTDLVHADDRLRLIGEMQRAVAEGRPYTVEYRINTAHGVERWCWERGVVVRGLHDEAVAVEGIVTDISVRRRMEIELRAIQARLQAAEQRARLGSWELDLQTRRGWWSAELYRMFGRDPALGAPDRDAFLELVHPDDRKRVADFNTTLAGGGARQLEFRTHPDRGPVRHLLATIEGATDPQGRPARLFGTALDVTERRRADEEVRESERLRRLIIDTDPECIKLVSPEGRLLEMNPAGLSMLEAETLEQAQACSLIDFIAPEHRAAFGSLHGRVMAGESGTLEFEVIGLKGARRWLETRAVPLRNQAGTVTALLGVTRDVTERRAQQERIDRLSRMRRVIGGISALLVRTRSRAELFQEACRIAVEQGGFGLAWIGAVQDDCLVPVALNGQDGGHLATLRFAIVGPDPNACPHSVGAVREARPRVSNRVATDEEVGIWRGPLAALGYQSFVSYPLIVGEKVEGCFNLYARQPDFFDADEMSLLAELVRDLCYALEFIIKDEKLDYLTIYDPLTRLPNRSLFLRRLQGFIQAAQDSGRPFALLMLDVERFKAINDATGHAGGDELLRAVADRLRMHAGQSTRIARITGDHFAAVIPDLERGVDVEVLVGRGGWTRLDTPFQHSGQDFAVAFKVGIAVFPQDAQDAEALLRNAELALKQGKYTGRRSTRYAAEMSAFARRKLELGQQLQQALERHEFALHYQPKVDLRSGKVCGAEALLRWQSPEHGIVMPAGMIPLMEETGLILDVGRWALKQALVDRWRWQQEGLAAPRVAVNVSAVQLREKDFTASVRALIEAMPGAAEGLELEITESSMMAEPDAVVAQLNAVRDLGVKVTMDDFGTGYSSLAYFSRLPLATVKIDRSFITTMLTEADNSSIVSAIIALAHSLNLRVVAEGVDADEQLRYLRLLRCDEMQGFLFSKALPAADFAALLRSGRTL